LLQNGDAIYTSLPNSNSSERQYKSTGYQTKAQHCFDPSSHTCSNTPVVLNPCRGSHIGTFVSRGSNFSYLYNSSETPAAPAFRWISKMTTPYNSTVSSSALLRPRQVLRTTAVSFLARWAKRNLSYCTRCLAKYIVFYVS
jgi:hypothetical protein